MSLVLKLKLKVELAISAHYYTSRGGFAVGVDLGRRPGEGPRRVCLRRTGGVGNFW
jgi:hypothetical protein